MEKGNVAITQNELNRTNLEIAGYQIDDVIFLRKTIIEFFHYARVSMDVLVQIINAALLGDKAYPVADKGLLGKVLKTINVNSNFHKLKQQLSQVNTDNRYDYLKAFDNYIKHIKTVLITVKNSFIIGNIDEFYINDFYYDNVFYEQVDALMQVKKIYEYVINTTSEILKEVKNQVPNCLDNSQRIHEIKFKMQLQKNKDGDKIDFIAFYIEVEHDLSELPNEIKLYPLIIKPNGEINSFDFRFDKLFIKKRDINNDEESIIGYAELKNGLDTNEFYRVFEVKTCSFHDYLKYISDFKKRSQKISINFQVMEGQIIAYDNK